MNFLDPLGQQNSGTGGRQPSAAITVFQLPMRKMCLWLSLNLLLFSSQSAAAETRLEFQRDIEPVLTKAGCNSGACHGSFQGRGGLRLSLLGYDPVADHETLFLSGRGRRVNTATPEESLILRKAAARIPHGGGQRLPPDSEGFRLLRDYITQGLIRPTASDPLLQTLTVVPEKISLGIGDKSSLKVRARWTDGVERDVTVLSLFDAQNRQIVEIDSRGMVTPLQPGLSAVTARFGGQVAVVPIAVPYGAASPLNDFAPHNPIDQFAATVWQQLGIAPAGLADDSEFLRRVYLDLIGVLPTAQEVRAFTADQSSDKRKRIVDDLLERPEYVDLWSLRYSDLFRVHSRFLDDKGVASFRGWIRQSVRENKPLTQWATELLVAQGNLFTSGPVAYYFVDDKPEELAETTAQVFLGIRLQCAKCHHHPNEVWGQDDYYGLAAFFTRVVKKDTLDQGRFGGARAVRPVSHDVPGRQLAVAAPAKVLGQRQPAVLAVPDDIRRDLAIWITARDNPYFARNFANRYWGWLIGRGLVEPVDDQRATNPPSHPELLAFLERELIESNYDPKHLIRLVCQSAVYQRACELTPTRDADGMLLTHRVPRRLPAELLLDAVNQVCGTHEGFAGMPEATRATELPDPSVPSHFLTTFGRPLRNSPCDCARSSLPDLGQALLMLNSPSLHDKLKHPEGRLAKFVEANRTDDEMMDDVYLAAFARLPLPDERLAIRDLLSGQTVKAEFWQDLMWTLINSAEFAFQH